jgi:hypothetical protein
VHAPEYSSSIDLSQAALIPEGAVMCTLIAEIDLRVLKFGVQVDATLLDTKLIPR